jgi:hypothetical protein
MKYSHTLLLPCHTKLVWVPDSQEPGTWVGSEFQGTENPLHNPFLCIFKHNEIFTNPSTAFSHKIGMGSGFSGTWTGSPFPGTRNPIRVPVLGISIYIPRSCFWKEGTYCITKRENTCSLDFSGTGTRIGFWVLGSWGPGTGNPPGFWVPGNPESIPTLCEKAVVGYVNTSLCLKMHKNGLWGGFPGTEPETDTPNLDMPLSLIKKISLFARAVRGYSNFFRYTDFWATLY